MMIPTGALSVVADFMAQARKCEAMANHMVDNECWNTAIEQKLQAEKLKSQAGMEFLLWFLFVNKMKEEPNPWTELQEKLSKEKEAKSE